MSKHITTEQAAEYRRLAVLADKVNKALDELSLATLQAEIPQAVKANIFDWIARAETFRGLPYFLTPQSEWLGGDSSDPKNFAINAPHIAEVF
jgi:hypothetical protein